MYHEDKLVCGRLKDDDDDDDDDYGNDDDFDILIMMANGMVRACVPHREELLQAIEVSLQLLIFLEKPPQPTPACRLFFYSVVCWWRPEEPPKP